MKQVLKKLPFLLLVLLHVLFLLAILLEKLNFISILIFIVAALMLMVIAYTKVPTQDNTHLYQDYGDIVFVVLGAGLAYYINVNAGFGPVIATGAVGTFASVLPWLNPNSTLLKEAPAAAYCGSFVGMSSPNVAGNMLFILFAGFVAGVLLVFSKNIFQGYGGKLGTIAFGGVALTYLVVFLFLKQMDVVILLATGAFAAISTYFVNVKLKQGPVRSSAVLSLLVGIFFYAFPDLLPEYLTTNIPVIFTGASFIGMVSSVVVSNYLLIGTSGFIFSVIYLNASKFFTGYGGGLGTAAAISLLVAIGLPFLTQKNKVSNGYLVLRKLIFRRKKS